uniref:Uncharacterized protein n=1 Tax=Arundo donax TaxID=35708 RepID=A0A0A9CYG7_ARUDO
MVRSRLTQSLPYYPNLDHQVCGFRTGESNLEAVPKQAQSISRVSMDINELRLQFTVSTPEIIFGSTSWLEVVAPDEPPWCSQHTPDYQ